MTSSKRDRAEALPQDLQEALRRRLAGRAGAAGARARAGAPDTGARRGIPRADRSRPLPLSFAQQRLWFLDRLSPGDAGYNSAVALRLTGRLDRAESAYVYSNALAAAQAYDLLGRRDKADEIPLRRLVGRAVMVDLAALFGIVAIAFGLAAGLTERHHIRCQTVVSLRQLQLTTEIPRRRLALVLKHLFESLQLAPGGCDPRLFEKHRAGVDHERERPDR